MDDTARSKPAPRTDGSGPDGVSRRWFLAGGGVLVLVGAATGSVVRLARDEGAGTPIPAPAPADLVAAADRERALIADLDATTGGAAQVRVVLARVRADHAAHLAALEQLLRGYDPVPVATGAAGSPTVVPSPSPSASGTARTVTELRTAETAAAAQYAAAAERGSGRVATLLASISACESAHAAVLA